MEALLALTLFGSVIGFWISVVVFLFICFSSDINENGFIAFGSLIIVSVLYYFWGDIKLLLPMFTLVNIAIYLGVGLLFSTFRTFFAGRELGKEIKDLPIDKKSGAIFENQVYIKEQFVKELKGNVFRWWFMWPVSLITWLVTDKLKEVWDWTYSKIKNFYNYILDLGIKSV